MNIDQCIHNTKLAFTDLGLALEDFDMDLSYNRAAVLTEYWVTLNERVAEMIDKFVEEETLRG